MSKNAIYVGIDVDDVHYHGSPLHKRTGEVLDFQFVDDRRSIGCANRTESRCVALTAAVDSAASKSHAGTSSHLLRHNGFHHKPKTQCETHWRTHHDDRLDRTNAGCSGNLKVNLSLLLRQLKSLDGIVAEYGEEVDALAATSRYQEPIKALTCYKDIKILFAFTIITEIDDVKRFAHPRQLVSWAGIDIREYASSGKSNGLGIIRQGNRPRRTAFIEASQRGYRSVRISNDIKAKRANSSAEDIEISDRCLGRLNKKGNRLMLASKHLSKVKVACTRKMVGFVWKLLNRVATALKRRESVAVLLV